MKKLPTSVPPNQIYLLMISYLEPKFVGMLSYAKIHAFDLVKIRQKRAYNRPLLFPVVTFAVFEIPGRLIINDDQKRLRTT